MNPQPPKGPWPDAIPLPGWMARLRDWLDALLSRWIPHENKEELDWVSDADWARIQQEPLRARFVMRWIGGILLVLLIWAGFAQVDEVARGLAKVIPSRQLQVMQAVDGGVVSEINVQEGQIVEIGQQLLKIDPTRFVSSLGENRVQYLALLAKAARLRAIAEGGGVDAERFRLAALAHRPAPLVPCDVQRQRVEPRRERALPCEGTDRAAEPRADLLRDVLGVGLLPAPFPRHAEDEVVVARHELGECTAVARFRVRDQNRVRRAGVFRCQGHVCSLDDCFGAFLGRRMKIFGR